MRAACSLVALLILPLNSMAQAPADTSVQVEFIHPEQYRDASLDNHGYGRGADDYVMNQLRGELQKLGKRYLPPGQLLRIDIRDIDLAGQFEPWHAQAYDIRFMREVTWPRIQLHYVLSQNGQVLRQADAQVDDKSYLQRLGRRTSSDRLYAEKAMLDDWFRKTFKATTPG